MPRNKGFIGWLMLVIIALAFLKYFFNWSIIDAANSEQGKNTIKYVKDVLNVVWFYVRPSALYIWGIIVTFLPARQSIL